MSRGRGRGGRGRGRGRGLKRAHSDSGDGEGRRKASRREAPEPISAEESASRLQLSNLPQALDEAAEMLVKDKLERQQRGNCSEAVAIMQSFRNDHSDANAGANTAIQAVLKLRSTDFHVHEVDINGTVVRLTSIARPLPPPSKLANVDVNAAKESLTNAIGAQCMQDLQQFVDKNVSAEEKQPSMLLGSFPDKATRSCIHSMLKVVFPGKVFSDTVVSDDGVQQIRVSLGSPMNTGFKKKVWSGGDDYDFIRFVLFKENIDTMSAVGQLAKACRMNSKSFNYSGNKDRRACTSQLVTAWKAEPANLLAAAKEASSDGRLRVGNFEYVKEPLALGSLCGNRFSIVLRQIDVNDVALASSRLQALKEIGFINYFGLQRFGRSTVSTHWIGRAILKDRLDLAVALLLVARDSEDESATSARTTFRSTLDYQTAIHSLSHFHYNERRVLDILDRHGHNAFANAVSALPRNMRNLYLHAYQSHLWNQMVSFRLSGQCGDATVPILGDLVLCPDNDKDVLVLTPDNISDYNLVDVVLPLPGHQVRLPDNAVSEYLKQCLQSDGLSMESFKARDRAFSLTGDYRRIICLPVDLTWDFTEDGDVMSPLIKSDADVIDAVLVAPDDMGAVHAATPETQTRDDAAKRALKLEFTLPSSAYATMMIREVLRQNADEQGPLQPSHQPEV